MTIFLISSGFFYQGFFMQLTYFSSMKKNLKIIQIWWNECFYDVQLCSYNHCRFKGPKNELGLFSVSIRNVVRGSSMLLIIFFMEVEKRQSAFYRLLEWKFFNGYNEYCFLIRCIYAQRTLVDFLGNLPVNLESIWIDWINCNSSTHFLIFWPCSSFLNFNGLWTRGGLQKETLFLCSQSVDTLIVV